MEIFDDRSMAKRSRLQMHLEVLRAIKDGTEKPTRIMYRTRLSWSILNDILSSSVRQGNIEAVDVTSGRRGRADKAYRITQKGENALNYFEQCEYLLVQEKCDYPK